MQRSDDGARAVKAAPERTGKKKKKKGGKSKGKEPAAATADDEGENMEDNGAEALSDPATSATVVASSAVLGSSSGAAAAVAAPVEECSICLALMVEEHVRAPCSGGHALHRGCWVGWRAETLKQGTEFSCPMCRESLEGWEPL